MMIRARYTIHPEFRSILKGITIIRTETSRRWLNEKQGLVTFQMSQPNWKKVTAHYNLKKFCEEFKIEVTTKMVGKTRWVFLGT